MQVFMNLVVVLQLVSAIAMIGLVLVQHGKGADMGASFGGGSSGSLFGATGSANFLSRTTAACATVFFLSTIALAYFGHQPGRASATESILDRAAPAASAAASSSAAPASAAAQIPGVAPNVDPAASR